MKILRSAIGNLYSICKKCGGIFHDSEIWKNNCRCPKCGARDWEDG